jgi:uncharacterized protein
LTVYLDTSVVIPLFVDDDHAPRVRAWAKSGGDVALSAWTLTEVTSALSMLVRTRRFTDGERDELETAFDDWSRRGRMLDFDAERFADARRLLLKHSRLRAPDALHLAIVRWSGLKLATLDGVLRAAAITEGVPVVDL